ncbi:MAG: transcriptional regulator GutM [Hespellia sp.]|nr:transcriptional regulator GutM [Hespellia sp.]
MNLIPLIIIFICAFALQYLLTFIQMKSFNEHYRRLRKQGRVAIGKINGALHAGAIAMFSIDSEGVIMEGSYMQGVTVFARFKELKGFEGEDVAVLTMEQCRQMGLAKPISKAVVEASSNYNILMSGGVIPEKPAPLTQAFNFITGKKKTVS